MAGDVTIIYRSGAKVHLKVNDLSVRHIDHSELRGIESSHIEPKALFLGMDRIEAIYDGKV